MSTALDDIPEPDRTQGAPHPRNSATLIGHQDAEKLFLDAFNAQRLHHGWLISGPRGIGKATLTWRIARFLLATPPQSDALFTPAPVTSLAIDENHPVAHRVSALSEPNLFLLRRPWDEKTKRLKNDITVNEVRKLKSFFALSASDGAPRVVIIDVADEMNNAAANALLKLLEEPPANSFLFLISHQPSRLLPTIRSRCRELRLAPLELYELSEILSSIDLHPSEAELVHLGELAAGSAGEALRLLSNDGLEIYRNIVEIFSNPNFDRTTAIKLAQSATGRDSVARFDLIIRMFEIFLSRLARFGAGVTLAAPAAPNEFDCFNRISTSQRAAQDWAHLQQKLSERVNHGRRVNLDPAALILDMCIKINDTAQRLSK